MQNAGLPTPSLQVVREIGGQRITRVDAEYRDPDVSIFLDGRAFHAATLEQVASDLEKRNRLEAKDVLVLEFTFADVIQRFNEVAETLRLAWIDARMNYTSIHADSRRSRSRRLIKRGGASR